MQLRQLFGSFLDGQLGLRSLGVLSRGDILERLQHRRVVGDLLVSSRPFRLQKNPSVSRPNKEM